jgi:hypothetical protein
MPNLTLLRGCLLAGALLLASGAALAKPPAYTLTKLGFSTSLHGVPDGERHEICFDKACRDTGGVTVAEGATRNDRSPVRITIREYKRRKPGAADLAALAKKQLGRAPRGKQVRLTSGTVGGRPAIEQWAVWDNCQRVISARVLVALPDKIIEIETQSTLEPGHDAGDSSVGRMGHILSGVRVRRVGDVSLDPAREPMTTRQMAVAMPLNGC